MAVDGVGSVDRILLSSGSEELRTALEPALPAALHGVVPRGVELFSPMAQVFQADVANYLRQRIPAVRARVQKTQAPAFGAEAVAHRHSRRPDRE